jgi:anti-sigma factor RsiW
MSFDPCAWCEEVLQPYLDRQLNERDRAVAQSHLDQCGYCAKRYKFEATLRQFVRVAALEEMDPALKQKLAALRTPL